MSVLNTAVSGMNAYQKMLDVVGNNLANVNSTSYKASSVTFSELLGETIKKASEPTASIGGTNPQRIGSGVEIAGVTTNLTQGNILSTGNAMDMAIEGAGYFVLNDGIKDIYTRAGRFSVDSGLMLIDSTTGYRVQRTGTLGEDDGFQISGDQDIRVPYGTAMPASATSVITISGNLGADTSLGTPQAQTLVSNMTFEMNGTLAGLTTELDQLDQFSGGSAADGQMDANPAVDSGQVIISGTNKDGSALSAGLTFGVTAGTTIGDFIDHLNNNVLTDSTATLVNGKVRIVDNDTGYSYSDIQFEYQTVAGAGDLQLPNYFEYERVGGVETGNVSITVYDSLGGAHMLSGTFVPTSVDNTWDLVVTAIDGDVETLNKRRIEGIEFNENDGAFLDLTDSTGTFSVSFSNSPATEQLIGVNFGTIGQFDGLTQFKGDSTAVAREQDGYSAGQLTSVSVNNEGVINGLFSNGVKMEIAQLEIGLFQNPAGLENVGGGYFMGTVNSGEVISTIGTVGGAGVIHGGSLESSNADTATEMVNLITAQNGFQVNARTIQVANEIMKELTNLIR